MVFCPRTDGQAYRQTDRSQNHNAHWETRYGFIHVSGHSCRIPFSGSSQTAGLEAHLLCLKEHLCLKVYIPKPHHALVSVYQIYILTNIHKYYSVFLSISAIHFKSCLSINSYMYHMRFVCLPVCLHLLILPCFQYKHTTVHAFYDGYYR